MADKDEVDTSSLASQDKVLIEKDGQFELVKASDVQASAGMIEPLQQTTSQTIIDPISNTDNSNNTVQKEIVMNDDSHTDEKEGDKEELREEKVKQDSVISSSSIENSNMTSENTPPSTEPLETHRNTNTTTVQTSNYIEKVKSFPVSPLTIHTSNGVSANTSTVRGSNSAPSMKDTHHTTTNASTVKKNLHPSQQEDNISVSNSRKSSAMTLSPHHHDNIHRSYQSASSFLTSSGPMGSRGGGMGTSTDDRMQLNERAFQVWIERKNMELQEKRRRDKNRISTSETQEEKLVRNREAFESWLRNKQRLLLSQKATAAAERIEEEKELMSEEKKREKQKEMFRSWLKRKNIERARDIEMEEGRQKELNEIARTKGTDIAQKAYKK